MTEVPEYLLRRSKERREALGLAPVGGSSDDDAGSALASAPESGAAPATAAPATTAAAAAPAAASSAPAVPTAPTETLPAYMEPSGVRTGIPVWMMPVLVILPLWVVVYLGSFGAQQTEAGPPSGEQVYQRAGCGGCHGAGGEGGVGPALTGGSTKLVFPNEADHIAWIENGSAASKGQPYGDPAQGKVATSGGMPAFKAQLSPEEIQAVVTYEREQL